VSGLRDIPDWLHDELISHYSAGVETWNAERVSNALNRINAVRDGRAPLACAVLSIDSITAFTLPGTHIYITRRLLEHLHSEAQVAFVFAHEMAHHDLRHLETFDGWAEWIPRSNASMYVAFIARMCERIAYSPEREDAADDLALELCAKAGYAPDEAASALRVLENIALDRRDVAGAYGPENLLDPADPFANSKPYQFQEWLWTRLNGYRPLRLRLERAHALSEKLKIRYAAPLRDVAPPRDAASKSAPANPQPSSSTVSQAMPVGANVAPRRPDASHVASDSAPEPFPSVGRIVDLPSGKWHCRTISGNRLVLSAINDFRNVIVAAHNGLTSATTDDEVAHLTENPIERRWVDDDGHEWSLRIDQNPAIASCISAFSKRDALPVNLVWLRPPAADYPNVLPWTGLGDMTHDELLRWLINARERQYRKAQQNAQ
jgi:hypothetical protein